MRILICRNQSFRIRSVLPEIQVRKSKKIQIKKITTTGQDINEIEDNNAKICSLISNTVSKKNQFLGLLDSQRLFAIVELYS